MAKDTTYLRLLVAALTDEQMVKLADLLNVSIAGAIGRTILLLRGALLKGREPGRPYLASKKEIDAWLGTDDAQIAAILAEVGFIKPAGKDQWAVEFGRFTKEPRKPRAEAYEPLTGAVEVPPAPTGTGEAICAGFTVRTEVTEIGPAIFAALEEAEPATAADVTAEWGRVRAILLKKLAAGLVPREQMERWAAAFNILSPGGMDEDALRNRLAEEIRALREPTPEAATAAFDRAEAKLYAPITHTEDGTIENGHARAAALGIVPITEDDVDGANAEEPEEVSVISAAELREQAAREAQNEVPPYAPMHKFDPKCNGSLEMIGYCGATENVSMTWAMVTCPECLTKKPKERKRKNAIELIPCPPDTPPAPPLPPAAPSAGGAPSSDDAGPSPAIDDVSAPNAGAERVSSDAPRSADIAGFGGSTESGSEASAQRPVDAPAVLEANAGTSSPPQPMRSRISETTEMPVNEKMQPPELRETQATARREVSKKSPRQRAPVEKSLGAQVWDAYEAAFTKRYLHAPIRNARTNTMCHRLVADCGIDLALAVVAYYLTRSDSFYVNAAHPIEICVKQQQKLITEMRRRRPVTMSQARQIEKEQALRQHVEDYLKSQGDNETVEGA